VLFSATVMMSVDLGSRGARGAGLPAARTPGAAPAPNHGPGRDGPGRAAPHFARPRAHVKIPSPSRSDRPNERPSARVEHPAKSPGLHPSNASPRVALLRPHRGHPRRWSSPWWSSPARRTTRSSA